MKLEASHLSYTYSPGTPFEQKAVRDVSLTIREGEFIALIGHTGSGKSTLIRHFNGLLRPASGDVLLDGESIFRDKKSLRAARFAVGLVFQYPEYQLFEETVEKDIAFGPKNMGLSADEIHSRVCESLRLCGLDESFLSKSPFDLSGGQKRRVALAGVLAMRPRLLILDEPAAGLDPQGSREIMRYIRAYAARGNSVLFVSHDMSDAAAYAERVLVMDRGSLALDGPPAEVFSQAERLRALGLALPPMTELFLRLREKGYDLPAAVFTPEAAAEEILRRMGRCEK